MAWTCYFQLCGRENFYGSETEICFPSPQGLLHIHKREIINLPDVSPSNLPTWFLAQHYLSLLNLVLDGNRTIPTHL